MRRVFLLLLAVLVVFPAVLDAQTRRKSGRQPVHVVVKNRKSGDQCCWGNRWYIEPYAGAFRDVYDISPDDENTSLLVGGRVGYVTGSRTRLFANVGYSQAENVADPRGSTSYFVYNNTWVFTTAGGEFFVVPGRTSAALGVEAGAAWRRVDVDGRVGSPGGLPEADRGFSSSEVIVPSIVARHRLSNRATIMAGLHDYMFDVLEGPVDHSIAFTVGFSFR